MSEECRPHGIIGCDLCAIESWQARAEKAEARVAELEGSLRAVVTNHPHSGACCTFDGDGKVIVTVASCKCNAAWRSARIALGWMLGFERPAPPAGSVSAVRK